MRESCWWAEDAPIGGMGMLEGRQERSSSRGAGASGPLQLLECTRLEGGDCHASLGEKSQGLRG